MMIKKLKLQIILIFLTAFFVIFYQFIKIPQYLAFDEVEFAKLALSLEKKPYTPYSPLATGHSTLYFYLILFSFKIFGINSFALRLPAAFFALLSVLVFYYLLKIVYQKENNHLIKNFFPFILTLIFTTLRWFFNFGRFSFEASFLLFLELTSIYFIFYYFFVNKKKLFLISSAIFAGLAFNSYQPGRIFFFLPIILIFLKNFKTNKKILMNDLLFFIFPFLIITFPLINYFLNNQDTRIDQLFFWRNNEMSLNEKIQGTIQNIRSIFLMFFFQGDLNGKHNYPGKPALNPFLAFMFFAGLVKSLKNIYQKKRGDHYRFFQIFFLFYFLLSLLPSLLVYPWENPNMLRNYTVLPAVVFLIGEALTYLIKDFNHLKIHLNKKIFYFLLFILFIFSSFYEIRTYFYYQKKVFPEAFEMKKTLTEYLKKRK